MNWKALLCVALAVEWVAFWLYFAYVFCKWSCAGCQQHELVYEETPVEKLKCRWCHYEETL